MGAGICAWALAVMGAGCMDKHNPGEAVEELELGPSLQLSFDDPALLTGGAARDRSRYLEDEGYTLARSDDGLLVFKTDTAGDLGEVDLADPPY